MKKPNTDFLPKKPVFEFFLVKIGLKDNDSIGEAALATAGNKRAEIAGKHFIQANVSI